MAERIARGLDLSFPAMSPDQVARVAAALRAAIGC
jgi:hypothetical protein